MIIFLTDDYSSREWCRKEVLEAKKAQSPIIVLDYYIDGESRLFPYLGNVRAIRINEEKMRYYKVLYTIMVENLRIEYYKLHTKYLLNLLKLEKVKHEYTTLKPELLSLYGLEKDTIYIYPEPPLTLDELAIIEGFNQEYQFSTPLLFSATHYKSKEVFKSLKFGFSVSYPSTKKLETDLTYRLQDVLVSLVRYLMTLESTIYYAGNPSMTEETSFSTIMVQVAQNVFDRSRKKLVNLLLIDGVNNEIKLKDRNNLKLNANLEEIKSKASSVGEKLELLRLKLVESIDVLILIGGKTEDYIGDEPGVLSEFKKAIYKSKMIFLVGAFGGASHEIAKTVLFNQKSTHEVFNQLAELNYSSLRNGLSEDECRIMATTQEYESIVALMLKGIGTRDFRNT